MNGTSEYIVVLWLLPAILFFLIPLAMLVVWNLILAVWNIAKLIVRFAKIFRLKGVQSSDLKVLSPSLSGE